MIFKGVNDQSVELKITNYQFPEITDCEYDSNWLLIYLKVKSDCGNWQTIDPSLLVGDVKEIIEWFEKISQNETPEYEYLDFIEPNLEFELIKTGMDLKTVRIKFDLESRPKSADDEKEYFVDCEMDSSELSKVIDGLKKEIQPYPRRAVG